HQLFERPWRMRSSPAPLARSHFRHCVLRAFADGGTRFATSEALPSDRRGLFYTLPRKGRDGLPKAVPGGGRPCHPDHPAEIGGPAVTPTRPAARRASGPTSPFQGEVIPDAIRTPIRRRPGRGVLYWENLTHSRRAACVKRKLPRLLQMCVAHIRVLRPC